jgi:hypothetical protein
MLQLPLSLMVPKPDPLRIGVFGLLLLPVDKKALLAFLKAIPYAGKDIYCQGFDVIGDSL